MCGHGASKARPASRHALLIEDTEATVASIASFLGA
jgi:hypothetical protein